MTSAVSTLTLDRTTLRSRFLGAVDRGEVILRFQPQVDLRTGRIVAVEALARWRTATLDLIPPEHFIPIAEETGSIVSFGEWVLSDACRQLAEWRQEGLPAIRFAVNVSIRQIQNGDIVDMVERTIARHGVDPRLVELELTEGQIAADLVDAARALGAIRKMGVRIAIDNFGTGFSSLSQLKHLPIDAIKLDRSFVREVPGDPGDSKITAAMIALAHSLGLEVMAEGVENRRQLAFLREHGCDVIQGFLLCRPMSAESCRGWILSFEPVDPTLVV
ncbi:MAG: EAL domain-containing protein [Alphaproteobacteria bacterium]|nr:EAL domain-containing protein [Alphaproteobacteria bacterium]